MERSGNIFSTLILTMVILVSGCASKEDLTNRQSQLFQTGIQQKQAVSGNLDVIEVQTQNGQVAITPNVVAYTPAQFDDPFEPVNRAIFSFNHVVYTWLLNPLAKSYTHLMPDPFESGVTQFFSNLREPLNAINHLLQANGTQSASSLGRFLINSTVGLLGLFDPADAWFGIEADKSTLNDTLTSWDISYGAYIVIPILGQSDVRNGLSTFTETTFAPITYLTESPQTQYIQGYDGFHDFSPRAKSYETLYQESDDPYEFFRNMYMQSVLRDKEFSEASDEPKSAADAGEKTEGQSK
ncbi:VacJ family lipoprotein [uncultured Paraglaciecola sp.]|uniref:MlaA family lipoprotein n=1 Tax=uncultured Paraglaciecola sp. TaxID=1765024 RepID=UPI00262C326A|nr:VacJ family lipoprotein [uncultured Paraglaciecola sp.]